MATSPTAQQLAPLPPGWQMVKDQASGSYYYHNMNTRKVSWSAPPPPLPGSDDLMSFGNCIADDFGRMDLDEDSSGSCSGGDIEQLQADNQRDLFQTGMTLVPPAMQKDANGVVVNTMHSGLPEPEQEPIVRPRERPATEITIDPTKKVGNRFKYRVRDLYALLSLYELDTTTALRSVLQRRLVDFFQERHDEDGTLFYNSDAFKQKNSVMDRKRKLDTRDRTGSGIRGVPKDPNSKRSRKNKKTYHVKPEKALRKYPDEGLKGVWVEDETTGKSEYNIRPAPPPAPAYYFPCLPAPIDHILTTTHTPC